MFMTKNIVSILVGCTSVHIVLKENFRILPTSYFSDYIWVNATLDSRCAPCRAERFS